MDLPGHDKLRFKAHPYLEQVQHVLFVIDSVTLAKHCRAASEYLYDVLTMDQVNTHSLPVTIVCNKADSVLALDKDKIQSLIEKEMYLF